MDYPAGIILQQFLLNQLTQAQHWQKALQKNRNPENVHQLRVCLRKIRTALRLSKPILKRRYRQHWQKRFRDAAKQLDKARDLDVFLLSIASQTDADITLTKHLKKQQKKTYKTLRHALHAAPFSHWRKLEKQLKHPRWIKQRCRKCALSLQQFAADQLEPIYQNIKQTHGQLDSMDDAALHRLRILCKQLRYACECVEPALKNRSHRPFLSALQGLQDRLGAVHDVSVQQSLLAECPTTRQNETVLVLSVDRREVIAAELGDFLRLSKPWASIRRK